MRSSAKPVRKCHGCPLNLGTRCWLHAIPRERWRNGHTCADRTNPDSHAAYADWLAEPHVKTRRELRRSLFRSDTPRPPPKRKAGRARARPA